MTSASLLVETLRIIPAASARVLADGWAHADTDALLALAEHEGAAIWLQQRLKALNIRLPDAAQDRLKASTRPALVNTLRVDAEASACLARLSGAGIPAVPLKGAAVRRLAARVPLIDARAVSDVDILVEEQQAERAWSILCSQGYTALKATGPEDGHHLAALSSPLGVPVELHVSTVAAVAPAEAWRRATRDGTMASFDGTMRPIPGDTELLWHVMSHALVTGSELAREGLRLRYWLDAAALLATGVAIDWERIRQRLTSAEAPRPVLFRAWLRTAALLAGVELPSAALGAPGRPLHLERMLAWRLRLLPTFRHDRWAATLFEEGTRGEAGLPLHAGDAGDTLGERVRHAAAGCAARAWWIIRRQERP
ncbi:MAG: hypothetical protein JWM95_5117 [Gemmatimonadetes bacterium]|nr:hypothetical protein [Gemmatimonadota bacterium]